MPLAVFLVFFRRVFGHRGWLGVSPLLGPTLVKRWRFRLVLRFFGLDCLGLAALAVCLVALPACGMSALRSKLFLE